MIGVGVIGCGYWGPNLVRNLMTCAKTRVVAVCDADPTALERVGRICPDAVRARSIDEVLALDAIDAVAIATPVATHAELAKKCLAAGKHVLVEKPMASSAGEGEEIVRMAQAAGLVLMVDHTFIYSPPVRMIKRILEAGDLGDLYYIDSVRINLGLVQTDINVVWDLAPHDLSIVDYLLGRAPAGVAATAASYTSPDRLEDVAYLHCDFDDGLIASFHVNWLSPVKIRRFVIGGSRKSLVYDHLDHAEPIKVYDRGVTLAEDPDTRRGMLINYRTGDISAPCVDQAEALAIAVDHFADCVADGRRPTSDGPAGLRVLSVLEAATRSIRSGGERQPIAGVSP